MTSNIAFTAAVHSFCGSHQLVLNFRIGGPWAMGVHLRPDRDDADAEPVEATDEEIREIFSDVSPSGRSGRSVEAIDQ